MNNYKEFLLIILLFCFSTRCSVHNTDARIKCISTFIQNELTAEQLEKIKKLHGVEFWEEWADISKELVEKETHIRDSCDINNYVYEYYKIEPGTPEGQYSLVFSIQSYIKNGYVDSDSVSGNVKDIISYNNQ